MLLPMVLAAQPVQDHHRGFHAGGLGLGQGQKRTLEGFALVDPVQQLIVAGFAADINLLQPQGNQLLQVGYRLVFDIAGQAVGRDAPHAGQVAAHRFQDRHQSARRKRHGVAVGQEYPLEGIAAGRQRVQFGFDVVMRLGTEGFLRRGVHFAEGAVVPRAAVGHLKNERPGLAGRPKERLDIIQHGAGLIFLVLSVVTALPA